MTNGGDNLVSQVAGAMRVPDGREGLSVRGIYHSFGPVEVLHDVGFSVLPGEVHALIGQNGSGKSTLMNLLSGSLVPTAGEILLDGKPAGFHSPSGARAAGIAIVHQEFALCENMTIADNIFLGRELRRRGVVGYSGMRKSARALLDSLHVSLDPDIYVSKLGVAECQIVEICKALADRPLYIIMDEPTAALGSQQIADLHRVVTTLRDNGHGIVYISHKFGEVLQIADRVTVLRDGVIAGSVAASETTEDSLATLMIGDSLKGTERTLVPKTDGKPILDVRDLSCAGEFEPINFVLKRGEVLGLTGILGSGVRQVIRALFGLEQQLHGKVLVDGNHAVIDGPHRAIMLGIGYVPADRKNEGLITTLSVSENIGMTVIDRMQKFGLFNYHERDLIANDLVAKLGIKMPGISSLVGNLSGGNQQKVSISKWLARRCSVLLFDEPTRGVDIGAKMQVWDAIRSFANENKGVLVVSNELPELIDGCDRILVMRDKMLVAEYERHNFDEKDITMQMMVAT